MADKNNNALLEFIYGRINLDQAIDILYNDLNDLIEEYGKEEFERIVDEFNKIPENYHA